MKLIHLKIGKTPGKDIKQGKSTLLKLIGEKKVINFVIKKLIILKKSIKRY